MPVTDSRKCEIRSCSFYCSHHSHVEEYVFCSKPAWHSGEHKFDCPHKGKGSDIVDIAFCCDTTGSMDSYLKTSISTV